MLISDWLTDWHQSGRESLLRSSVLVVAFLHGSVLPQVVERLQLSGHEFPPSDHLLDPLRVLHIFVFSERCSQAVPEVVAAFGILSSEVEELWSHTGGRTSTHFTTEGNTLY